MSTPTITTASELVRLRAADDGRGILFEGREWTWAEAVREASARAGLFAELREPGPFHVAVLLENSPEYLFILMGAALGGATIVGLNPSRRGDELAGDLHHTDCQLVITDSTQAHHLEGIDLDLGDDRLLIADSSEYLAAVSGHADDGLPDTMPDPTDLFMLIFTSGSTGRPKAVRLTQGRAARSAARVPFSSDDVLYSAMPLFHGNALNAAVFPAWACGSTIALRRKFSASGFLPDIRESGATFFNSVGRAIAHIVATEPTGSDRDHSLKYVLGPETSEPDKIEFTRRFGVPLFEGYGSSENTIILLPRPDIAGALGEAQQGEDIAVVSPEGVECPRADFDTEGRLLNAAEATGEIVGRNVAGRFEGYYKNDDAESERIRNGWYWSGDLAYRDLAGVFYFAGRSGDWLRVDQENFAAAPVDRILNRWEAASGVAVYAVPDSRTADQVMAAIEMEHGRTFDPDDFAAFLAAQPDLGTKWAPRYVRIVDSLPVTGTDKIDKTPLRSTRWDTLDPLWHRVGRSDEFVPMTSDDVARLYEEFEANGRSNLLQS